MQIIGCQPDILWENKPANHQRVRGLFEKVSVKPGAFIVLPEMFDTGYSMNVEAVREGPAQPTAAFCSELARDHGAWILAGVVHQASGGRGRNDAIVLDPDGHEITRYTKMHPMSVSGEAEHYVPGEGAVHFTIDSFTVSPFICYDLRFPEVFRDAVADGAQLLAVIANWPAVRQDHWRALLIARAIENQAYVVGVNRTGSDPKLEYVGGSIIVDPRGQIITEAHADETVIVAEIELDPLLEYRERFPALADRRI